jgi:hypothetical protein
MARTLAEPEGPRYLEVAGTRVRVVSRAHFFRRMWRYKAGECVTFLAPMQDGKTTLAFQLLERTARASLPALVLVMKPRDATPASWTRHLGYREVATWPPPKKWPWEEKPKGYTLWPRHTFNVTVDNEHMTEQFESALQWAYQHGNCIVFADEVYGIVAELDGLTDDLIALWSRGGGMGVGLWAATQRPAGSQGKGVPGFMYSNSTHLFLSKDPDEASRRRYGEIGGIDPRLVAAIVMSLKRFQFLYIRKADEHGGPYLCVIEAS